MAAARPNDRLTSALGKHGYSQIKKVGEGSFGAAILVHHPSFRDRDKAIVKMIDISRASRQEKEDAVKESQVLSSLKHPYIVRYRESFHEDGWLCIVMDYCEGGDLSERVKKMRTSGKIFPQEQVVRWFTQAILALKYIHDLHILHRDLKSGNFFLSRSGNIKVGDFGIAKVLECTAACAQTQIGTPYYLSPEICQGKPYAWSSDIWSMGCILYEICNRRVPFDAPDLKSLIQRITKGATPEIAADYSANLRELGKELLDRDPGRRPPAGDILKKPLVQEMVRRMLEEVKSEEDATPEVAKAASSQASDKQIISDTAGTYGGYAGSYVKGDLVEFYSETHKEWLPATVTGVDGDGLIMLNVKPNVWLSLQVQGLRVRPKTGAQPPPSAAVARQPSAQGSGSAPSARPPLAGDRAAASPSRAADRRQHSDRRPSPAADGAMVRQPSRDGLNPAGQRQPTPDRGIRAASPRSGGPAAMYRGPSADRLARRPTPTREDRSH